MADGEASSMIEIVFVDDEPSLLSGLRRMLYSMRSEWSMRFIGGGQEALESIREKPADVVVSDMRMPGMDGAMLLGHVRDEFPDTVRIILSGYTEFSSALRSVPVAHQFLNKPCDSAVLKEAVQRSCELQRRLSSTGLRSLVGSIGALPTPSRILQDLNAALASAEPSMEDVTSIVSRDVAMSAKLLQLANSAFFGLAREVKSVNQAISYLGLATVRDLTTAAEAFRSFTSTNQAVVDWIDSLEGYSNSVAAVASQLMPDQASALDAYAAGLMHDIGALILATSDVQPTHAPQLSFTTADSKAEMERIGTTHADLGAYLLTLWGLPYPIVDAVAHHHDASSALPAQLSTAQAVHVAVAIAEEARGIDHSHGALDPAYLAALGIESKVDAARQQFAGL